jgi:hypothetical protein
MKMLAKCVHRDRPLKRRFNSLLDGIVQPKTFLAGRTWNTYNVCIFIGFVIGTTAIFALSSQGHVSLPVMAALVVMLAMMPLALFKSTKILGPSDPAYPLLNWAKSVVYHLQIVALIWTATFLWIMREPVLAYLDILVVGAIICQVFLKIGCLMAGCCHGQPHAWGVCYGRKYAETGYPYFLEEVRLFPIQLTEALWLFLLAAGAIAIILQGYPPGENVSWYIVGYGAGRFFFEFLRADQGRVFIRGFSEAQWTAVLLTAVVIGLECAGVLSFHWWHAGVLLIMVSVIVTLSFLKRLHRITLQQLLHPDHIKEVYQTVDWILLQAHLLRVKASRTNEDFLCGITSLGIEIALQEAPPEIGPAVQYRLSHKEGALKKGAAEILARLIVRLKHAPGKHTMVENGQGVYQLAVIGAD